MIDIIKSKIAECEKESLWYKEDKDGQVSCPICKSLVMLHCSLDSDNSYLECQNGHRHAWNASGKQYEIEAKIWKEALKLAEEAARKQDNFLQWEQEITWDEEEEHAFNPIHQSGFIQLRKNIRKEVFGGAA